MGLAIPGTPYTWLIMSMNFICSVAIVWCNKIASNNGFPWTVSLTAFHFVCTFLGLWLASTSGKMFTPSKTTRFRDMIPICLAFIGFVVFNNLSLKHNSIGLYQLMKVMTTPVICVLQYILHRVTVTWWELSALAPICVGVAIATVTTINGTTLGFIFGGLGILSTSLYQVWVKSEQSALKVNSMQLLHMQAPISFFMLLGFTPVAEPNYGDILKYEWLNPTCVLAVIASGILAALVNISIFLVISETSPLSYNVLGHAKLCTILSSGYFLFGDPFEIRPFTGLLIAVFGIVYYPHVKAQQAAQAQKTASTEKNK